MEKEATTQELFITIKLDAKSGAFEANFPSNFVLALGMLESAREMLMMNRVRPAFAPQVMAARAVPQLVRTDA